MSMPRQGDPYYLLVDEFRRWRMAHKIPLRELSLRIGVSDSLASRWECDDRRPDLYFATLWAQAIGTRLTIVPLARKRRPQCPAQLLLPY